MNGRINVWKDERIGERECVSCDCDVGFATRVHKPALCTVRTIEMMQPLTHRREDYGKKLRVRTVRDWMDKQAV